MDGTSDSVGRVLAEWQSFRGASIIRSRNHTFERRRGDGVVMSRIDFPLAGGGVERGELSSGWGLLDHSAIGCLVAVDHMEMMQGSRDAVDWAKVQLTVTD